MPQKNTSSFGHSSDLFLRDFRLGPTFSRRSDHIYGGLCITRYLHFSARKSYEKFGEPILWKSKWIACIASLLRWRTPENKNTIWTFLLNKSFASRLGNVREHGAILKRGDWRSI